jgi:hypothetical protein
VNPQATNHPISWIKRLHLDEQLDLSPTFQRKPVWSGLQQSYLIDTILNDLPVPEIFVRASTSAEGETKFEVVDGQQRLRAIIKFYEGQLALEGEDVSESLRGLDWEHLDSDRREHFFAFKLVVRELEHVSDAQVRDMFRRLNANQSSLNDQELRHAQYSGAFIQLVEGLAMDTWWLENRVVNVDQIRRMYDTEFVSELMVGLMGGPLDKKQGLDDFYSDYDEEFPDADLWRETFLQTRKLAEDAVKGEMQAWKSKTEFYSLFLACGRIVTDGRTLDGEDLDRARANLSKFRVKADKAKRKGITEVFPHYVTDYAESVTRASTDLGRRLVRINIVESLLLGRVPKAK